MGVAGGGDSASAFQMRCCVDWQWEVPMRETVSMKKINTSKNLNICVFSMNERASVRKSYSKNPCKCSSKNSHTDAANTFLHATNPLNESSVVPVSSL